MRAEEVRVAEPDAVVDRAPKWPLAGDVS